MVSLAAFGRRARLEADETDALAVLGAATPTIDERRVESVHVKVDIVDEEALANCDIAVLISLHIELDLVRLQLAAIVDDDRLLVRDYATHVPVFFRLKLG